MKAPATQLYWKDLTEDLALGRCSWQARGAWIWVLAKLHQSDEHGVLRWPLTEIARSSGVPLRLLRELSDKNVIKGSDTFREGFTHTPKHAGRTGEPVVIVEANGGPCWFSARFVRDEWVRSRRGADTRFTAENQPGRDDSRSPTRRVGERQGDGPASASASASAFDSSNNTATETLLGGAEDLAHALREVGYSECSAHQPDLVTAKAEGITAQELVTVAKRHSGNPKPISYLVQAARGKRADAAERGSSRSGVGPVPVAVDPAVVAASAARHRLIDQRLTIANDHRLQLIDDDERDRRLALLEQPAQRAAGAVS